MPPSLREVAAALPLPEAVRSPHLKVMSEKTGFAARSFLMPCRHSRRSLASPRYQSKAQRSGFALERRNSGASELSDPSGSERCKACSDEELLLTDRSLSKKREPQTGRFMPSCLYEKEPPPGSPSRCQYSTSECAIPCHPAPTAFTWHKWNNWHSIFPKTLKYPYIPYIPCAVRPYLTLS